jgi:lipopolysaccharide transport system permease protein
VTNATNLLKNCRVTASDAVDADSFDVSPDSNNSSPDTFHRGDVLTVYSAESVLLNLPGLVREIGSDVWRCRELIWILFLRDLMAAYRQSVLGYAWIVLVPLATSGVWLFLNSQQIVQVATTPIPYAAFVLAGTTLWTTFAAAFSVPQAAFDSGRSVFMKLKVPPETFLLAALGRVFFELAVRMALLIPALWMLNSLSPITALLFPLAAACLVVFGFTCGMLLLPIGSLYSDVGRATSMALTFWMYLSPVIYPTPQSGFAATFMAWNPVTPMITVSRDLLTLGHTENAGAMILVTVSALLLLLVSTVMLRVCLPHLVARMGM